MESRLAEELRLRYSPVAIIFTDKKPEGALQFKQGGWGCAIAMFTAAARGKTAVFDRDTIPCRGATVGLCFGESYHEIPGGIDYLLSTGRGEGYPEGEAYKKTPELARTLVEQFPIKDIPFTYVVFKPLGLVDESEETPQLVSFYADADQLSALVVMANYGLPGNENVIIPMAAACSTVCLIPYHESLQERPRAVVGITDISGRPFVDADTLAFTVPFAMFKQMEADVPGSFLEKKSWAKVRARIPQS